MLTMLPSFNDTTTTHSSYTNLTGLVGGPHWANCPLLGDEHMLLTIGLNSDFCAKNEKCLGPQGFGFCASMNNRSFVPPSNKRTSMLEAFFKNKPEGLYTRDFPDNPPEVFHFISPNVTFDLSPKSTKVMTLKFDSTVEIVLQIVVFLALGFGVFNATRDRRKFNVVNHQRCNTVAVPAAGWAVIRFKANNPDAYLPWGLAIAFEVQNGPTPQTSVPPPPPDLPLC